MVSDLLAIECLRKVLKERLKRFDGFVKRVCYGPSLGFQSPIFRLIESSIRRYSWRGPEHVNFCMLMCKIGVPSWPSGDLFQI